MVKKDKKLNLLGDLCLEVYNHLGGLNFDEKDFQVALGYELTKKGIEYLRETHIELYYKDVPIGLTTKDSRSTFLINRDLMTRFKVNVNPNRKFVLSSWIERSDNNDTRGVNLPLEKL